MPALPAGGGQSKRKQGMIRILFVCHGNICRSPMAEFIFRDMAARAGVADLFEVASAATSTDEIWDGIGNPVYPNAAAELAKRGLSCAGKRAVLLKREDYGRWDMFVGMDGYNIRNMRRIFGGDPEGKISLLLDYPGDGADVPDPWYTRRFDFAASEITRGCAALLEKVKETAALRTRKK